MNPPAEKAKIKFVLMIEFVALVWLFTESLSNISAATAPIIPTVAVQNWAFAASHLKKNKFLVCKLIINYITQQIGL